MALRLGLIGFPVQHSLSPAIQQPALDTLGINAVYELWQTSLEDLSERVESLREPNAIGANVTVPHKQAVIPFLDHLSETATRAHAVNTVINRSGTLLGDNTDVFGLARSLTEAGITERGFSAVVIGAGGAARGVLVALETMGAGPVTVANRTVARAQQLARAFPGSQIEATGLEEHVMPDLMSGADVVINATSLGWNADEMPIARSAMTHLPDTSLVMDLTYRQTTFLQTAEELGMRTLDGLPMLVYQGAKSLELWTGREAPVELMMQRALEARSARS